MKIKGSEFKAQTKPLGLRSSLESAFLCVGFILSLHLVVPQCHRLLLFDDGISVAVAAPALHPVMFNITGKNYSCFQDQPAKFLVILIESRCIPTMPEPISVARKTQYTAWLGLGHGG